MNEKLYWIKKAHLWAEINILEQEYCRNIVSINELQKRQQDIFSEIEKKLNTNQKKAEKREDYLYENKLGEFKSA